MPIDNIAAMIATIAVCISPLGITYMLTHRPSRRELQDGRMDVQLDARLNRMEQALHRMAARVEYIPVHESEQCGTIKDGSEQRSVDRVTPDRGASQVVTGDKP